MAVRFYHRTTFEAITAILAEGFRDAPSGLDDDRRGVWFSRKLDCWGEAGRELLEVMLDVDQAELDRCAVEVVADEEFDEDTGEWVPSTYVEKFVWYVIAADTVNARGRVRLVDSEERRMLDSGWRPNGD